MWNNDADSLLSVLLSLLTMKLFLAVQNGGTLPLVATLDMKAFLMNLVENAAVLFLM